MILCIHNRILPERELLSSDGSFSLLVSVQEVIKSGVQSKWLNAIDKTPNLCYNNGKLRKEVA